MNQQQQRLNAIRVAINEQVEKTAREKGYNGSESLVSYVNSGVPAWASEAQVFITWRDQVWSEVLTMLSEVEAGNEPMPSMSQALASVPPINWPEV